MNEVASGQEHARFQVRAALITEQLLKRLEGVGKIFRRIRQRVLARGFRCIHHARPCAGQTSMLLGTTKYMAPELFSGEAADGRADMYSLGLIMYEMLLGREKFNEIFHDVVRDIETATLSAISCRSNSRR